jgi:hypothetical protein
MAPDEIKDNRVKGRLLAIDLTYLLCEMVVTGEQSAATAALSCESGATRKSCGDRHFWNHGVYSGAFGLKGVKSSLGQVVGWLGLETASWWSIYF